MMITAHSGSDGTADNSLAFIRYALSLPVDAFEVDVRMNSAGELILSHDETQEEAVRLSDAFRLLRTHPDKRINCDLKQQHIEAAVVFLAECCGVGGQLIFTGSVDASLYRKSAANYPDIPWYANIECFPEYDDRLRACSSDSEAADVLRSLLDHMQVYETAGLNWNFRKAELVWQDAKAAGIGISVWTVDDPVIQRQWLERGVANITTRRPAQLVRIPDASAEK